MDPIRRFVHNRNFPLIIILLFGVILGLFIFSSFGASWDEYDYYQYARSTLKAYSISDHLAGTFELEKTLFLYDLRYYGPAFLIAGEGVRALLSLIFPHALLIDTWHLTIYLSYLLGIFFFYKLAQRWVSTYAAIVSTLLFASQPVLFGMAWINPKDIPFMVFFLGAIYLGFVFSDQARLVFRDQRHSRITGGIFPRQKWKIESKGQWAAFFFTVLFMAIGLFLVFGAGFIRKVITNTILAIDIHHPVNFIEKIFIKYAQNAQDVPLDYYANKGITIYNHLLPLIIAIIVLFLIVSIGSINRPGLLKEQFSALAHLLREFAEDYQKSSRKKPLVLVFLGACIFLGLTSATRILGPFAALLVVWIWVNNYRRKSIPLIGLYALVSFGIMILFWPYLWQNTIGNILYVIQRMSNFPDGHPVLFGGEIYDSRSLPASYFPTLLMLTLTEPGIILFLLGLVVALYKFIKKELCRSEIIVPFLWFFTVFFYIVITTLPMYNNYRQFLFILPAAFLFSAFSIDFLFKRIKGRWIHLLVAAGILFPGFLADIRLHPYEYAYYNSLSGGIQGAAHQYELDYWLTCYKALSDQISANEKDQTNVYYYETQWLESFYKHNKITPMSSEKAPYLPGSLIVLPLNFDHSQQFPEYPTAYAVKWNGLDLCEAKRIP